MFLDKELIHTNEKNPEFCIYTRSRFVLENNSYLKISSNKQLLKSTPLPEEIAYAEYANMVFKEKPIRDLIFDIKTVIKKTKLSQYYKRKLNSHINKILKHFEKINSYKKLKPLLDLIEDAILMSDLEKERATELSTDSLFDLVEVTTRVLHHPNFFKGVSSKKVEKYFNIKYDEVEEYNKKSWRHFINSISTRNKNRLNDRGEYCLYIIAKWKESYKKLISAKVSQNVYLKESYRCANTLTNGFSWSKYTIIVDSKVYQGTNNLKLSLVNNKDVTKATIALKMIVDREAPFVIPLFPGINATSIKKDTEISIDLDGQRGFGILNLDIKDLAFIGDVKASHLNKLNIVIIKDLVNFDIYRTAYQAISLQEMRKFIHMAKLLLGTKVLLKDIAKFENYSLERYLTYHANKSTKSVQDIVKKVKTVQLFLNDSASRDIRMGELVYTPKADIESYSLRIDGKDLSSKCSLEGTILKYKPSRNLKDGPHDVEINVEDIANNSTRFNYNFKVDAKAPEVEFVAPIHDSSLSTNVVTIHARLIDYESGINTSSVKITVNGRSYTSKAEVKNNSLVLVLYNVKEKKYKVAIQCSDNNGNRSKRYIHNFTIDRTPPIIELDSENDKKIVYGLETEISGQFKERDLVELNIGERKIKFRKNGTFKSRIKLNFGANIIQAIGRDSAGNTGKSNNLTIFRLNQNLCAFKGSVRYYNTELPIPGALVVDTNSGKTVTTDEHGYFILTDISKDIHLINISVKAVDNIEYSPVSLNVDLRSRRIVELEKPIYLHENILLDKSVENHHISTDIGAIKVINDSENIASLTINNTKNIEFPSNENKIAIKIIEADKSHIPLPSHINAKYVLLMEPSGLVVNNDDIKLNIATGLELHEDMPMIMYSYDKSSGAWVSAGLGKITDDKTTFKSMPGAGIRHFSALAVSPIPPVLNTKNEESKNQNTDSLDGAIQTAIELPGFVSMNIERKPKLIYNSFDASPRVILNTQFQGFLELKGDPELIDEDLIQNNQQGHIQQELQKITNIYRERNSVLFWRDKWEKLDRDEVDGILSDEGIQRTTISHPIYLPLSKSGALDTPFVNAYDPGEGLGGIRVETVRNILDHGKMTFYKFDVRRSIYKHENTWLQSIHGDYKFSSQEELKFNYKGDLQLHGPVPFVGEVDTRQEFPTLPENLDITYITRPHYDDGSIYPTGVYSSLSKFNMKAGGVSYVTQSMQSEGDFILDEGYLRYLKKQVTSVTGYRREQLQKMINYLEENKRLSESGEVDTKLLDVQFNNDPLQSLIRSRSGANIVHNLSKSPFGAGWSYEEVQQLIQIDQQRVLAIGPEGKQIFTVENKIHKSFDFKTIAFCKSLNSESIFSISTNANGNYTLCKIGEDKNIDTLCTFPSFLRREITQVEVSKINGINLSSPYNVSYKAEPSLNSYNQTDKEEQISFKEGASLSVDWDDNVYISDRERNKIYMVDSTGKFSVLNDLPRKTTSGRSWFELRSDNPHSGTMLGVNNVYKSSIYQSLVRTLSSVKKYQVHFSSLVCYNQEDRWGSDHASISFNVDGVVWRYPTRKMKSGNTWHNISTLKFNSYCIVNLYEKDDIDSDDHLLRDYYVPGTASSSAAGYVDAKPHRGVHYRLNYTVTNNHKYHIDRVMRVHNKYTATSVEHEDIQGRSVGDLTAINLSSLNQPSSVINDKEGNLLVAEAGNNKIRKFNFKTGLIETIAGNGTDEFLLKTAPALSVAIPSPRDLFLSEDGELYILMDIGADYQALGKIDLLGNFVYLGGTLPGEIGSIDQGVNAHVFNFRDIQKIRVHKKEIYCLLKDAHQIIKIDSSGIVSLFAGDGHGVELSADEGLSATQANFKNPCDMLFTAMGNLLIADTEHSAVKLINLTSSDIFSNSRLKGPKGYFESDIEFEHATKSWLRTYKDGHIVHFNELGQHFKTVDKNKNETSYLYDATDKITRITYPGNSSVDFYYTDLGHLNKITDHAGRTTEFKIIDDQLREVVLPNTLGRKFSYTDDDNLVEQIYSNGASTQYELDIHGRLISAKTNDRGARLLLPEVHGENNNTSIILSTNSAKVVEQPSGEKIEYTQEGGQIVQTKSSGNSTTKLSYNVHGQVVNIVSKDGAIISNMYNENGDFVSSSSNEQPLFDAIYNKDGKKIFEQDSEGFKSSWEYDNKGNLLKVIKGNTLIASYDYDNNGRLKNGNEQGIVTGLEYDEFSNLSSIIQGNYIQKFTRNTVGSPLIITEGNSRKREFQYDTLNRVTKVIEGNESTQYEYTKTGRKSSITDALDNQYRYTYDDFGNLSQRVDLANRQWNYGHDELGRTKSMILPDSTKVSLSYGHNSKSIITTSGDYRSEVVFINDKKVAWATDYSLDIRNEYDSFGNKSSMDFIFQSMGDVKLSYRRLKNTMISGIQLNQSEDIINYKYDASGFLSDLSLKDFNASYEYDANGKVKSISFANGVITEYTYHETGRILSIESRKSTWKSSRQYAYDSAGDMSTINKDGTVFSYEYTPIKGQLKSVKQDNIVKETYDYDKIYNRLSGPNGANTLDGIGDLLLEDDLWKYEYNANGNLSIKTSKSNENLSHLYHYDHKGNLIKFHIEDGGGTPLVFANYRYGPLGERVEKNIEYRDGPEMNSTRYYIYEDGMLMVELDELFTVYKQYIYDAYSKNPIGFVCNDNPYYFIKDNKQNVEFVLDKNGDILNSYEYDSYGNRTVLSEGIENDFGYCSKMYDSESGLYYSLARHYDPLTGRFIQPDPLLHSKPEGRMVTNAYIYANANPIRFSDPSGLDFWDDLASILVAAVALVIAVVVTVFTLGAGAPAVWGALGLAFAWVGATAGVFAVGFATYAAFNGKHIGEYFMKGLVVGFYLGAAVYTGVTFANLAVLSSSNWFIVGVVNPLIWTASFIFGVGLFIASNAVLDFMQWVFDSQENGEAYRLDDVKLCAHFANDCYEGFPDFIKISDSHFKDYKVRGFISNEFEASNGYSTVFYYHALKSLLKLAAPLLQEELYKILLNSNFKAFTLTDALSIKGYTVPVSNITQDALDELFKTSNLDPSSPNDFVTVEEVKDFYLGIDEAVYRQILNDFHDTAYSWVKDGVFDNIDFQSNENKRTIENDTNCYVLKCDIDGVEKTATTAAIKSVRRIIVTFRGTAEPVDILTDASFFPVVNADGVSIHTGFLNAFKDIQEPLERMITTVLDEFKAEDKLPEIIFTGHSLGGSVAIVAAYYTMQKNIATVDQVFTFGSPRVGNIDFSEKYSGQIPKTFRFVNDEDVVPTVPARDLGFLHVNSIVHLEGAVKRPPALKGDPAKDNFDNDTFGEELWEETQDAVWNLVPLLSAILGVFHHSMVSAYLPKVLALEDPTE